MHNKIIKLLRKYRSFLLYGFFGICTTLLNVLLYFISSEILKFNTVMATVVAWIGAVMFAYISNLVWVFESRKYTIKEISEELFSFFSCRLITGLLDVAIMFLFVDVMGGNDILVKTGSNLLVTIINYVASKLIIFGK